MKNRFEIRGKVTAIFLDRRDGTVLETLISTDDLEKAQEFEGKWYAHLNRSMGKFYAYGNGVIDGKKKTLILHSHLLDIQRGMFGDHINHDTLDNRRSNLRVVTQAQNNQNKSGAYKNNNSSGFRGVTWHKRCRKWEAQVMINKKQKHLGLFTDLEEAKKVVTEARANMMPYSQEKVV